MNREIKFRGYSKNDRRWIFGSLFNGAGNWEISDHSEVSLGRYDVEEDSVGQYTGIKDKHNNDIYEGDIVRFPELYETPAMTPTNYIRMHVVFLHGAFHLQGKYEITVDTYNLAHEMLCYDDNFEVIGNVYENSELLNSK